MAGTVTASIVKNDTTSPPTFQNSAGTEIGTLCRSWVNFSASGGTVTVRASFNTSSVIRNSAGNFTVNLTTAQTDANFAICCGGKQDATYADRITQSYNISSSSYGLVFAAWQVGSFDATWIFASVFR